MRERYCKVLQCCSHIRFWHERDIVFLHRFHEPFVRSCHCSAGCSLLLYTAPDSALWRTSAFHGRYTLNRYPSAIVLVCPATCHLLCRVLDVHPSGFYAWLQQPHSQRHQTDLRLTGQIKQFWLESGCVYGYRKIHLNLRDSGQQREVNRVWRLMKRVGIKAQVGYRSPQARKGEASIVSPNRLQRQFNPDAPDERVG